MDRLQLGLILGGFLLIQILYFGFDTVQLDRDVEAEGEEVPSVASLDVNIAIDEAMADLDSENRDSVTAWTEQAETGDMMSLKQLSSFWVSRSEEHTSELQSRGHLVCRLLLEKKNTNI